MKASEINCPNCGAPFENPITENRRECSYCGSVFNIDAKTSVSQVRICDTEPPAKKLFKMSSNKTFGERPMKTFEMLCVCLNESYTSEKYMELFKKMTYSNEHMATPIVHKDLLDRVSSRALLSPNETAIFWNSNGIISKHKSGVLLTNKNIYIITKTNCKKISFNDVNALKALNANNLCNVWYINSDASMSVDAVGCTDEQLGIILAFICTKARDFNLKGYRITIE